MATPENFTIELSADSVPQYGLLEIRCTGIDSSGYGNVFDPEEVRVDGWFTDPDGMVESAPGFWYQSYGRSLAGVYEELEAQGQPCFLVRYAPRITGQYSCDVVLTDALGEVLSEEVDFTVTASNNAGFVGVSQSDNRYFAHDNGDLFFGIGMNLCWPAFMHGTYDYDQYFSEMGEHKCNMARVWMYNSVDGATEQPWVLHVQDKALGTLYDLADAWRMDYLVEQARQKGIYLMLCFDDVNEFIPNYKWGHNLYNAVMGGPLALPLDFFTDEQAKTYYKRLLRYFVARWGYSTSVLAWELWNEIHELAGPPPEDMQAINAWHAEMAQYIKAIDVNQHMVTSSNGSWCPSPERPGGLDFSMPDLDFAQMHGYTFDDGSRGKSMVQFVRSYSEGVTVFDKPAGWGECGVVNGETWGPSDWINPFATTPRKDSEGIHLHNMFWSGLMNGLAAIPAIWWWTYLREYPDWWNQYKAIAAFIEGEELHTAAYQVVNNRPDTTGLPTVGFEPDNKPWTLGDKFSIVSEPVHSGEGALHWDSDTPEEMHASRQIVLAADTEYVLSGWVWSDAYGNTVKLRVGYRDQSKWHFYGISIPYETDGWQHFSRTFTTPPADTPDGLSTDATVYCTAAHAVGSAWFDDISVQRTVPILKLTTSTNKLRVMGLMNNKGGLFWIHNRAHTWYDVVVEGLVIEPADDATMTVPGLQPGYYEVEWWDTWTGLWVYTSSELPTDDTDALVITLPSITTDWACKIRPVGEEPEPPEPPEPGTDWAAYVKDLQAQGSEILGVTSRPKTEE